MVAFPWDTPETTPVDAADATLPSLLLHVPPAVASVRLVVKPTHTEAVPVIAAGNGLIVTETLPSAPQQPAADTAKPGGKKLFIKQAKKLNFLKIDSVI